MSEAAERETVSVVIGAYNAAAWIGQTLESVLVQTCPVLEVLVVDDGSTDDTPAIVKSYGAKVQYLAEEHRGRPHRNRGILASRGELVAFVDADDYWHPTKIEKQLSRLRSQGAEWVICDSEWLDVAGGRHTARVGAPVREGDILEHLFLNNFIVASTPMVARRVLDEIGHFDETPEAAPVEDWDLWLRIAARYPVATVQEKLATLRLHDDSFLAATPLARRLLSLEHVVAGAVAREPARLSGLRRRALFNVYYAAGITAFRQQRIEEARSYFLRAWRDRPTHIETAAYVMLTFTAARTSTALVSFKRRFFRGR
ncbi:MAG: glycosyltransferase [Chloroflexota bacterium]